jgi:AcrR family transcriptional regulator
VTQLDRPRRKYAPRLPRDQRRTQLLDAALEVLGDNPLHELSMEAVARTAGIGKPVLYTAFRTRSELVAALLHREHVQGMAQVLAAIPTDLSVAGPTGAYRATVSAFLAAVLDKPTRWRLILTVPDVAPREYRDSLRQARSSILAQAEQLARLAGALQPNLGALDPALLGHTLLSFAEMLGRLAVSDPGAFPRERLESFATTTMALIGDGAREPQLGADTSEPH